MDFKSKDKAGVRYHVILCSDQSLYVGKGSPSITSCCAFPYVVKGIVDWKPTHFRQPEFIISDDAKDYIERFFKLMVFQ